ncbi:MAG TPA: 2-oxoacid:ferredoxin oxidoreductase subunit beta [bacterium]|nr:2-oxoacid:ferredoxin oxidoreductase subunit beta [bacterium]
MLDLKTFNNQIKVTWCPGCGDYGILSAVKSALAQLEIHPHEVMFFSGIGCGSKLPDYMNANSFTTIHGRSLPVAQGTKLANHDLHVICITGDGDGYGIGGNHFLNILRRNSDIVHIAENNMVYGLTKGQYAPTSERGFVTSTTPEGSIEIAFNPLATAINGGATFVARGFSGDPKHLAKLIMAAIQHKGYALVDVLQPCVIYNKINTYDYYRERVYKLEEAGHNPADREGAWRKAQEWGEKIPIGILYQIQGEPTYEDQVSELRIGPVAKRELAPLTAAQADALRQEFF